MNVLVAAVGLKRSELHDSSLSVPVAGKVNFDVHLTDSNAHAGVAGAIPSNRETPLPVPTLTVGPKAFQDLASLRATLLHEYTHMRHAVQTIEAVERWRATTTDGTFESWLTRQHKTGKLDAIDFAVIKEQVTSKTSNTESLSYLVSFTATYARWRSRSS